MKNPEEHIKAFDDWIAQGNRLLKIGDTIFLPILDNEGGDILVYACDNMHTMDSGWVPKQLFGEMISEKGTEILIDKKMNHIPLSNFAENLIYWDSHWVSRQDTSIILILFSFDQIDTGQLPGRVLEELMVQKLSKQILNFWR